MSEPEAAAANADPNKKDPNADLYETKTPKKLIRLVTVVAYMFSVSFVAIVLSAYYLFLWVPPDPKLLRRPVHQAGDPELNFLVADDTTTAEIPLSGASKFGGRIADDDVDAKSRLNKQHESLNESLLILKMFLTEQQRKLRHASAGSNSSKERLETESRTEKTLLVANSTTVFADGPQGFAKGAEHIPVSPRTKTTAFVEETNVTDTEIWPAKDARNYRSKSFQEELSSTVGIVALIHRSNLATDGKESPDRLAINASRNWKFADRLESNPPFQPLANIAMNSKETQLEKVTVRSVSNESNRTEEPEVATTTSGTASRPKNLLTILTTTATSSSSFTELTPRDLTTNPNTETRESLSTNTSTGND
ncbi:uncharacterized protein LOC143361552 [Halictus rubicundus]|uniref:uncharacterized protein LOC143361552 n=1 Tax=Halictus rubicundus TaxID=77578 RepID=UPI0040367622